jgi:hypothetical protein
LLQSFSKANKKSGGILFAVALGNNPQKPGHPEHLH